MANKLHKDLIGADIHVAHAFTFANDAARTGATGLVPADVGKIAKQTDTNEYWILTDDDPVTWKLLTGISSIAHADTTGQTADDHHAKSHAHDGVDGSGTVAHADTTGQGTDDHHAKLHAADHIKDGADEVDGDKVDIDFTPTNYTPSTAPAEATDVDHLAAHLAGIDAILATIGGNRHIVFSISSHNASSGDYDVLKISVNGTGEFAFGTPADFGSLVSLKLVGIANSANPTADIDFFTDYAAVGEDAQNHSQSDTTTTYNIPAVNEVVEFDIKPLYTSLAAGDICGLKVTHNSISQGFDYTCIVMEYTPA